MTRVTSPPTQGSPSGPRPTGASGPPTAGLTLTALEKQLGVTRRVVHSWVAQGLLAPPQRRGPKTSYDEAQILRIRAIIALRARRMGLDAIKRWLLSATRDQLEALVRPPAPAPAPAPAAEPIGSHTQRWERVELVQGLELHVESNAGPLVRRLAREIFERYSVLAREADGAP